MTASNGIAGGHRWLFILFTLVVAGIFVLLGLPIEPPTWLYLLPLLPLLLLMGRGLCLLVLPQPRKWRGRRVAHV